MVKSATSWLADRLVSWAKMRMPDLYVGGKLDPYLIRWHLLPRNPIFNVYLHKFLRSDDDRALHDHPWANLSILLKGSYTEHTIAAGGIHHRVRRVAGDWVLRWSGKLAHRIEINEGACWTLFITGPKYREWGFHCRDAGWIHWRDYTHSDSPGEIGRGCG